MRYLYTILLSLSLMSCSGSWHMQRAIKKSPGLFDPTPDTAVKIISKPMPRTTFALPRTGVYIDTIIYISERDSIIYSSRIVDDVQYVDIDCPDCADSVKYINVPIPTPVYLKPSIWRVIEYALYGIAAVLVLFLAIRLIWR